MSLSALPAPLQPLASDILQTIIDRVAPTSILLLGSTARGEASFHHRPNGQLELFSDLEFLVVTPRRVPAADRQLLHQNLKEIETRFANPNPLFHIDLLLREKNRLDRFPALIFVHEMRTNGLPLYGPDPREQLPVVTLDNLDHRNTNEIIYKRLWALLAGLPRRFVMAEPNEAEVRITGYLLARNLLDIPTVLLPYEGILLPTYDTRVTAVTERFSTLRMAKFFPVSFPHLLQESLQLRRSLNFAALNIFELYELVVDHLATSLTYLLNGRSPDALLTGRQPIFNEWPISPGEWRHLAGTVLALSQEIGVRQTANWLFQPRRQLLCAGLLAMHLALTSWLANRQEQAAVHLATTMTLLSKLEKSLPIAPEGRTFAERWLSLREIWAGAWCRYFRVESSPCLENQLYLMNWYYE